MFSSGSKWCLLGVCEDKIGERGLISSSKTSSDEKPLSDKLVKCLSNSLRSCLLGGLKRLSLAFKLGENAAVHRFIFLCRFVVESDCKYDEVKQSRMMHSVTT